MNKTIRAIYQGGVFHPLEEVDLKDKSEVLVTVELTPADKQGAVASEDPIAGITFSSGLGDLSQRFDDYRFGSKQ
jgi:predicted DNA-binding antitoxin AbrB/MazE fold protein